MLRRDPRLFAQGALRGMVARWRSGPSRLRLRRKLMLFSAPAVIVALLAAFKMISVVIVGDAAVADFARRDTGALRGDISTLHVFNVIDSDNVRFAQGDLAAFEGNLGQADARFSDVLSHTDASQSCPVRINLELVRETQGDLAARDGTLDHAEQRYTAALAVINDAARGCFEGNNDPDQHRRAIRNDAAARLADKIRALHAPRPATTVSQPQTSAPPPPPPPPVAGSGGQTGGVGDVAPGELPASGPVPELQLHPRAGNPVDRLQEALRNSDAAGQASE